MKGYGNFKKTWAKSWDEERTSYTVVDLSIKGMKRTQWEEMGQFVKQFRGKRASLGLTQVDVGAALGQMTGGDFSQTTISRFEALNLTLNNMLKLRPALEKWLQGGTMRKVEHNSDWSMHPIHIT